MTSCMSFTAEPFFLPDEDAVQKPLRAAGFTEAAYKECLQHGVNDYAAWKTTPASCSRSTRCAPGGPGAGRSGVHRAGDARRAARSSASAAFRQPQPRHDLPGRSADYALMKKLGPEIVFQTYGTNPTDFEGTIRMGVAQGATSIELWQDYGGFPRCQRQAQALGRDGRSEQVALTTRRRTRPPARTPGGGHACRRR